MGIASFSPRFSRSTGLSILLAPIQTQAALFLPEHPASAFTRPDIDPAMAYRALAQAYKKPMHTEAKPAGKIVADAPLQRLKVVRQFEPGVNRLCAGRLVISGRMSDVCAALDRMAG